MSDVIWILAGTLTVLVVYWGWARRSVSRAAYELHQSKLELDLMKYFTHLAEMIRVGDRPYAERVVAMEELLDRIRKTDRLEHYPSLLKILEILESSRDVYLEMVEIEGKIQDCIDENSRLLDLSAQLSKIGESDSPDHDEINRLYDEVLKITTRRDLST